jgi:hypothetical protein
MASRLIGLPKGHQGGSNSVVECHPSKVDVAGSNPVSRSIFFQETAVAADLRRSSLLKKTKNLEIYPSCFPIKSSNSTAQELRKSIILFSLYICVNPRKSAAMF